MIRKKMVTKKILVGSVVGAMLSAAVVVGFSVGGNSENGRDSDLGPERVSEQQVAEAGGERPEGAQGRVGGESRGEHGAAGESGPESGGEGREGSETGAGPGEEASGATMAPDATFDSVRAGARLILNYDPATNAFMGTVENTTNSTLTRVRIEVHLSNGTELGPTMPVDLAPGEVRTVNLPSTAAPFNGWIAHAEVGSSEGGASAAESGGEGSESGSESGSEHGAAGASAAESGGEGPGGGEEASGATMAPDATFDSVRAGARLILNYDPSANAFTGTVENTTNSTLTRVRIEVHLSNGTELGPTMPVDLAPGEVRTVNLSSTAAPFNGWIAHAEVGSSEGGASAAESGGEGSESGSESAGEHGAGGERRGSG